ncbi:MAG: hypothetical protein IPF41_03160 [Flavobacteriales bacterium]|nr:hypothetical protein [Flavobacteriales bacterium]
MRTSLRLATLTLLLLAIGLLAGCKQDKDSFVNRTYHRLTARDNGWFNANEKLKETVMGIEDAHVDDFDKVLPLFIYGSEQQAKSATPDLEKCIDKCSLVIERHSMDIKGKEKNTWIDDAWFVIARSQFYKRNHSEAERGFAHITRQYKGFNREYDAKIWLARTAIELEQFGKAQSALDHVGSAKKRPKHLDEGLLAAVHAELELKRGKVDDAIMHLERAIPIARTKRERVRWAFVLAQLYQLKGQEKKAIDQFAAVAKMGPPYEMAFHAQIFQALAYNKGDSKALRKMLKGMLRDDKHIDHFDMIHYALAELDLKERKKEDALAHLRTSVKVSTNDSKQKAKSFLKLADVHFDDRLYRPAQQYYDSTKALLNPEHVRFDEVETRARVLGDLVEQLEIIAHEDSLQALMGLDPEELQKKIRSIIRQREDAEEEQRRKEEEARSAPDATAERPVAPPPGGRGNWYFYDPQQVGRGMANFKKKWGNRKLEDDWRRQDRSGSALAQSEEEEEEEGPDGKEGKEAEWKDPESYLRDIPKDEAAVAASNGRICGALYASGMIYKEQLKDIDNAIESFEVLNNRFEECQYTPESHYQLYRIYLKKESEGWVDLMGGSGSKTYADIILERWPDSEFARLVRDPNLLQADAERRAAEEVAYRDVYRMFRDRAYYPTITACDRVILEEPNNHFRPKYHFLKAMAIGGTRNVPEYRTALTTVKDGFPGTEEATRAEELLASLDGASGGAPKPKAPTGPAYSPDDGPQTYVVVVPSSGADMDVMRAAVSDFNAAYFGHTPLQVSGSILDAERRLVLIAPLPNKAKAIEYHNLFYGNEDMLQGLADQGYPVFAISQANYATFFKDKDVDGYQAFFLQNYLDGQ